MTYWPISSPSVFAATKDTRHIATSHDGTEATTQYGDDATESSVADSEERTESEASATGEVIDESVAEQQSTSKQDSEEQVAEDDVSGEILAIQVTRSGHMFATITRSTLTIWQTKACPSSSSDNCD